jgi:hypothetical protein
MLKIIKEAVSNEINSATKNQDGRVHIDCAFEYPYSALTPFPEILYCKKHLKQPP